MTDKTAPYAGAVRMSPAELRDILASVPASHTWLAGQLGVNRTTLQRWISGRDPIPYRVPAEIAVTLRASARNLMSAADAITPQAPTGRRST